MIWYRMQLIGHLVMMWLQRPLPMTSGRNKSLNSTTWANMPEGIMMWRRLTLSRRQEALAALSIELGRVITVILFDLFGPQTEENTSLWSVCGNFRESFISWLCVAICSNTILPTAHCFFANIDDIQAERDLNLSVSENSSCANSRCLNCRPNGKRFRSNWFTVQLWCHT